jgi:hypothetical protein
LRLRNLLLNKNKAKKSENFTGERLTFDFNGKIMKVKQIKEDTLPEVINPETNLKMNFKTERQLNRLEDRPKDENLISQAKNLIQNAIEVNQPLIERLKQSTGTVDIEGGDSSNNQKPSEFVKLKPGVNLNELGKTIKGPLFKHKTRLTLREYFTRRNTGLTRHKDSKSNEEISQSIVLKEYDPYYNLYRNESISNRNFLENTSEIKEIMDFKVTIPI